MKDKVVAKRVKQVILAKKEVGPFRVELYPTRNCNLSCIYCDVPSRPNLNELTDDKLIELTLDAIKLCVREFSILNEGEPLIRKQLCIYLMCLIKRKGCYSSLITNGTLLSNLDIRKIVSINWDEELIFSVDSYDERTQDKIRGKKGSFKRIVSAIHSLNRFKKKMGKDKPEIYFNTVISTYNYRNLIAFVNKLEIQGVYFDSLVVYRDFMRDLSLSEEQTTELMRDKPFLLNLLISFNLKSNLKYFRNKDDLVSTTSNKKTKQFMCLAPWYQIVIMPDRSYKPCCNYSGVLGTITNASLEEIWHNKEFTQLRNNLLNNGKLKCMDYCTAPM